MVNIITQIFFIVWSIFKLNIRNFAKTNNIYNYSLGSSNKQVTK